MVGSVLERLEELEVFFVYGVKVDGRAGLQQHRGKGVVATEKFSRQREEVSEREDGSRIDK